MVNKQAILEELDEIRFKSMSEGKFPIDLDQFHRFCELLKAIVDRLPDDPAADISAEGDDEK